MSEHVDLDAEAAVLGAVLLGGVPVLVVAQDSGLRPEHFYRDTHGEIFAAMTRLANAGRPIDALTVHAMLRGRSDITKGQVESLAAAPPVTGHAKGYAEVVVDEARWRWRQTTAHHVQAAIDSRSRDEYAAHVDRATQELAR